MTLNQPTPGASVTSPVFLVPELLEKIIAELPPLDIIRYQQISRLWNTVIASSPLLQYKAWLRNDCPGHTFVPGSDDLMDKYDDYMSDSENEEHSFEGSSNFGDFNEADDCEAPTEVLAEEETIKLVEKWTTETAEKGEFVDVEEEEEEEEDDNQVSEKEESFEEPENKDAIGMSDDGNSISSKIRRRWDRGERKFYNKVSKRLNPIVVAHLMRELLGDFSHVVYEGHISMSACFMSSLIDWHEAHKDSEELWGKMPLFRPDVSFIEGETCTSEGAEIDYRLEAKFTNEPENVGKITWGVAYKGMDEPLALTLRDFMHDAKRQWKAWLEAERDEHWLSHDAGLCDYDRGLPDHGHDSDEKECPSEEDCHNEGQDPLEDFIRGTKRPMASIIFDLAYRASGY